MKVILTLILIPLFIIGGAVISALFLYAGWNWGVVPAVPAIAKAIDFGQAFWLSIAFWTIGSAFKATLKTKES